MRQFPPFLLLTLIVLSVPLFSQPTLTHAADPVEILEGVSGLVPTDRGALKIRADRLEYRQTEGFTLARGAVLVEGENLELRADRVELWNVQNRLVAEGQVQLLVDGDRVTAERIELDVDTSEGVIYQGRIDQGKGGYHITGEQMMRLPENRYEIIRGSMTTCDLCAERPPAWLFEAEDLRLQIDQYAVARRVLFSVRGVPVIYLPYLVLPVKTTRQTGLLVPSIGYSPQEGVKLQQPFFWAIDGSRDLTFTLDVRSQKGLGGTLEYRYVPSHHTRGMLEAFYFYDRDQSASVGDFHYEHAQRFSTGLSLMTDLNFLSDRDVRRDLSPSLDERARTSLESDLLLHHRTDLQSFSFLARYFQNLREGDSQALQRLPEIRYSLTEFPLGDLPLVFGGDFSLIHFWWEHERPLDQQVRALRLDLYPTITWPLDLGGVATLTSQIGFREIYYSRGLGDESAVHREVPVFSLQAQSLWGRFYPHQNSGGVLHLIEPLILYEYADPLEEKTVPQFDAVDRITRKHLVTARLTQRWWWQEKLVLWRLTQSYDLGADTDFFSDLRSEWAVELTDRFRIDLDAFYDHDRRQFSSIGSDASFEGSPFFRIFVGQRYLRAGSHAQKGDAWHPFSLGEQVDLSEKINFMTAGVNLWLSGLPGLGSPDAEAGQGITLASRAYYDLEDHRFAELDIGIRFRAQCWEIILDYRDAPDESEWNVLLSLKGAVGFDSPRVDRLFGH